MVTRSRPRSRTELILLPSIRADGDYIYHQGFYMLFACIATLHGDNIVRPDSFQKKNFTTPLSPCLSSVFLSLHFMGVSILLEHLSLTVCCLTAFLFPLPRSASED